MTTVKHTVPVFGSDCQLCKMATDDDKKSQKLCSNTDQNGVIQPLLTGEFYEKNFISSFVFAVILLI